MSGFVYIWYDKETKRYYIGSHWGSENDGYICSSDSMREAYRRRSTDFRRKILAKITTNHLELLVTEQRWLDMIKPYEFGRKYYNINSKVGNWAWWMNEETKQQVIEKMKGNKNGCGNKNKPLTEQRKQNISKSKIGKKNPKSSKTLKEKYQNGYISFHKGRKRSEETKQKMRQNHWRKKCLIT